VTTGDEAGRIQQELEAALQAVAEHQRVRARLARARQDEEVAQAATDRARKDLATEETDVRRLESYSPTRIWAALRGSRDADLDREQAERQAAEYAVALAQSRLSGALDEVQRSETQLAELGDVAGRRERALAAKEEWLTSTADEAGAHLVQLAQDLASTRSAANEVREAVAAAELAASRLELARRTLGSAGDWATYDTFFGGGMFSDMVKYQKMDEAQRLLHDADQALRNLSVELADVGVNAVVHGLAVDGLTQTFDVWFDNIFSDWSVRARITEAAKRAEAAAGVVHQIRGRLAQQEGDLAERERAFVADRERLLTGNADGTVAAE
jgi:hypothetical protein